MLRLLGGIVSRHCIATIQRTATTPTTINALRLVRPVAVRGIGAFRLFQTSRRVCMLLDCGHHSPTAISCLLAAYLN
jgi:hypothetical protein